VLLLEVYCHDLHADTIMIKVMIFLYTRMKHYGLQRADGTTSVPAALQNSN
jgi:hypothetical protein